MPMADADGRSKKLKLTTGSRLFRFEGCLFCETAPKRHRASVTVPARRFAQTLENCIASTSIRIDLSK